MINDILLISCPNVDGGLFMVNGETCVRLSNRATTGMSVSGNTLVIAYQDNDGKSIRVIKDGWTKEIGLGDSRLDFHDVFFWQGKTYVVATETNSVLLLNENYEQLDAWRLPGENDALHLNSITLYEDRLLASVFGRFQYQREYKKGSIERGEVIDIQTGETFIDGLSQPHSLTVMDDLLYICNSEERQVRVYHGSELLQQIDVPGYTRGLEISGENIYVGISLTRNESPHKRGVDTATIIVLDRETMQQKDKISLPCSEIYNILTIPDTIDLFPHILIDLADEKVKSDELLAQYQQGFESYKRGYETYKREYESYKIENENLIHKIEDMRQSKSWRFTKPFRIMRNKIRR